ncbi:LysR family transcriptional regulator [Halobacteriovorax sp. GB3]|uniref:LysR family transcriptional regulator n=1 Tax=Halobacteriovorax sp. GB3 TaxID=2719615 RepID=UPI00235ECBE2|nr:LysR family transcriptional regulator [Halobacteriovorax sp. GB3]MDD0854407.1 LysR family transcriptional regulator [Halobacteriovorax sp. GB3]
MLPSHNEITYFLKLANVKNISKASKVLGVSQPTLTMAMQKLENSLQVTLFHRHKKGITLTKAGEKFRLKARDLIENWNNLYNETRELDSAPIGQYKFGLHRSVGLYMLPLFFPKLSRAYPDLELIINHDLSRHICESIITFDLDLGLVINPTKHPDLILQKVLDDEVTLFVKSKGKIQKNLIYDSHLIQSQELLKRLKKSEYKNYKHIHLSSLENITKLCETGAGIALLPKRVATCISGTKIRPLNDVPFFKDELYLAYRLENKNLPAIQAIKETILASLSKETS